GEQGPSSAKDTWNACSATSTGQVRGGVSIPPTPAKESDSQPGPAGAGRKLAGLTIGTGVINLRALHPRLVLLNPMRWSVETASGGRLVAGAFLRAHLCST